MTHRTDEDDDRTPAQKLVGQAIRLAVSAGFVALAYYCWRLPQPYAVQAIADAAIGIYGVLWFLAGLLILTVVQLCRMDVDGMGDFRRTIVRRHAKFNPAGVLLRPQGLIHAILMLAIAYMAADAERYGIALIYVGVIALVPTINHLSNRLVRAN